MRGEGKKWKPMTNKRREEESVGELIAIGHPRRIDQRKMIATIYPLRVMKIMDFCVNMLRSSPAVEAQAIHPRLNVYHWVKWHKEAAMNDQADATWYMTVFSNLREENGGNASVNMQRNSLSLATAPIPRYTDVTRNRLRIGWWSVSLISESSLVSLTDERWGKIKSREHPLLTECHDR